MRDSVSKSALALAALAADIPYDISSATRPSVCPNYKDDAVRLFRVHRHMENGPTRAVSKHLSLSATLRILRFEDYGAKSIVSHTANSLYRRRLLTKQTHKFLNLWVCFSQVMRLSTSPLKHQYSPPATHCSR